jgi:hypothetical protein
MCLEKTIPPNKRWDFIRENLVYVGSEFSLNFLSSALVESAQRAKNPDESISYVDTLNEAQKIYDSHLGSSRNGKVMFLRRHCEDPNSTLIFYRVFSEPRTPQVIGVRGYRIKNELTKDVTEDFVFCNG